MKENRNEIEIQANAETIWEVLTDLDKYAEWNPLLYRAYGTVAVGEEVNISARTDSNDRDFRCSVVRVVPNREFSWKFHVVAPFLFRGEHIFTIEPIGVDRVRLVDCERFDGLLVPLQAKDLESNAKVGMIAMDEALKKRVENLNV